MCSWHRVIVVSRQSVILCSMITIYDALRHFVSFQLQIHTYSYILFHDLLCPPISHLFIDIFITLVTVISYEIEKNRTLHFTFSTSHNFT